MRDELGGNIMTIFVGLRLKTYAYLTDDDIEEKKAKGTKKCIIRQELMVNDYIKCLGNNQIILRSQ